MTDLTRLLAVCGALTAAYFVYRAWMWAFNSLMSWLADIDTMQRTVARLRVADRERGELIRGLRGISAEHGERIAALEAGGLSHPVHVQRARAQGAQITDLTARVFALEVGQVRHAAPHDAAPEAGADPQEEGP